MHIDTTSHEHGATGKVYAYEGEYELEDDAIRWKARVSQAGTPLGEFDGSIRLTSPAIATLAEQAVRDAIVKRIDTFDDKHGASLDGA
ncbi:MAG: hypothetical protein V4792_12310, partial [Pseudomonadota bacterium]